jgi:gluconolactonase
MKLPRHTLVAAATGLLVLGCAAGQPRLEAAASVGLLEGPTADLAGNVYFSDVVTQRIMKLDADGRLSTFRTHSNGATGLLLDAQGRLIACEAGQRERPGAEPVGTPRVTRTTLDTGVVEILAERVDGRPLAAPNDLTIDSHGRIYFTDMADNAVYRIDGPGEVVRILGAPDIENPNGIQISPDGRTLYVSESGQKQGDRRDVRAFDLAADGSASRPRLHHDFYPGRSADGMSVDIDGNLYVSAGIGLLRGTSETLDVKPGVYVISPAGRLLDFISVPQDLITNNAFGGPDLQTLYVTAGATLYRARLPIRGLLR